MTAARIIPLFGDRQSAPAHAGTPSVDHGRSTVGVRVERLRQRVGLSRRDLGDRIGGGATFVDGIEANDDAVTPQQMRRIAEVLGVREELFYPAGRPDLFWSRYRSGTS